jgi:hypothetical protein
MAQSQERQREIKVVSASGQISLGKAFAGETVMVERLEDGQWLVTPVQVTPKHLAWANTPEMNARLARFEERLKERTLHEPDLDALEGLTPTKVRSRK